MGPAAGDRRHKAIPRRSEKLTLVFEAGGEFTVPAAELRWWTTASAAIETATAPSRRCSTRALS